MTASPIFHARAVRFAAALAVVAGMLGVCSREPARAEELRILVPSAQGSGTDLVTRTLAEGLRARNTEDLTEVLNVPGGNGLVGLASFVDGSHNARLLLTSLTMLDAALLKRAPVSIDRLTPIARLSSEPYGVVVPESSPYRSLDELRTALLADPPKIAWAGGPTGSTDHVGTVLLGRALGIELSALNYVAFLGTSDALNATTEGRVAAAFVPVSEATALFGASKLRLLAVAAEEPRPERTAPTLRDRGVDLVFGMWRGIVARSDISLEERTALTYRVATVVASPDFQAALGGRGWQPAFLAGDDFARFILAEQARLERTLRTIGALKPPGE